MLVCRAARFHCLQVEKPWTMLSRWKSENNVILFHLSSVLLTYLSESALCTTLKKKTSPLISHVSSRDVSPVQRLEFWPYFFLFKIWH